MNDKIDLRGLFVPEILFKLDIKMNGLEEGEKLIALIDDPTAEDWIIRWAHSKGHDLGNVDKVATGFNYTIEKGGFKN